MADPVFEPVLKAVSNIAKLMLQNGQDRMQHLHAGRRIEYAACAIRERALRDAYIEILKAFEEMDGTPLPVDSPPD